MYVSRRASKVDLGGGASIYIYIYIIIQDLTNKKNHNSFDTAPVSRIDNASTGSEDLSRTQLSAGLHGAKARRFSKVSRGIFSPEIGGNHVKVPKKKIGKVQFTQLLPRFC